MANGFTPLARQPASSDALRDQLALQIIGRQRAPQNVGQGLHSVGQSIASALAGRSFANEFGERQAGQQEALARILQGTQEVQGGTGEVAGQPGLLPPQQAETALEFAQLPGGRRAVTEAIGQKLFAGPADIEAPKTRNILEGGERVFQQFNPNTGQWEEVGRGPAFAPPTQINVGGPQDPVTGTQGPGATEDLGQAVGQVFDPETGQVNRAVVTAMNIPGGGGLAPAASQLTGAISTVAEFRGIGLDEARDLYFPSITDSDATIRSKLQRLERDLSRATGEARRGATQQPETTPTSVPSGEGAPSTLEQAIDFVQGLFGGEEEPQSAEAPTVTSMEAYSQLPVGALYRDEDGNIYRKRR